MSLNGLDDVKVKEAHDAAAAEPGGWFLLNYTSRDEVGLLGRGNGGIVEMRNAIAQYDESSPLFGFLRYRRRHVLIKYVPEGCSRLIQARMTVHFNAVTERFSPHDTVFPITTSKELRDAALSAACSLHTASGSTSSSTSSLRRRRLMEIAEDEEDENAKRRQSTVHEELPLTTTSSSVTETPPPPSEFSTADEVGELPGRPEPPEPATQSSPTKTIDEPRISSSSARPDLYSYSSYGSSGRPKVKLGPRPSIDVSGRPHTSSAASQYRPVSSLPAGLRVLSRGSKSKERPKSQYSTDATSMMISPPPIPETPGQTLQSTPARPHTSGGRPSTSSGASIRTSIATSMTSPKSPTITPEKARLMKALQLRKKQMKAAAPTAELAPPPTIDEAPTTSVDPLVVSEGAPKQVHDTLAMLNDMAKEEEPTPTFDANSTLRTDESDTTRSDSNSGSPIGPSEQAESTRASSISDSTDETVQEPDKTKEVAIVENLSEDTQEPPSQEFEGSQDTQELPTTQEPEEPQDTQELPTSHEPQEIQEAQEPDEGQESYKLQEPQVLQEPLIEPEPVPTPEVAPVEEFPQLLPVTYQPPPSRRKPDAKPKPVVVEEIAHSEKAVTITEIEPETRDAPPAPADGPEDILPSIEYTSDSTATAPEPTSEISSQVENATITADGQISPPQESSSKPVDEPETVPPTETATSPASATVVEIKEWKVPRSKFSLQNLRAAADAPPTPTEPLPVSPIMASLDPNPQSPVGSSFSVDTRRSLTDQYQENGQTLKRAKRTALVEPIRTDIDADRSGANSEANFSSDDDLMDELQSAVVQEAKPISVSKSPISPAFPGHDITEPGRFSRASSNPLLNDRDSQFLSPHSPANDASRSVSASAYLNRISQHSSKQPVAKKVNVGSGISQRIKALEQLSKVAPGAAPPATAPAASATFFSVRKASVRSSKPPSIADRTNSLTRKTPSPPGSQESSPEPLRVNRTGSVQKRLSNFIANSIPIGQSPPKPRPESVSVTARIIRDPNDPFPGRLEAGKSASEYAPLDLKQSPLTIDHQKAVSSPTKDTADERRSSVSSKASKTPATTRDRRSSITVVKDFIREGRASFSEHRRSMTVETSGSSSSAISLSRPPSTHASKSPQLGPSPPIGSRRSSRDLGTTSPRPPTAGSFSSTSDEKDRKSNRASRMLRRMSSSMSSSRKTLARAMSPTLREESEPPIANAAEYLHSRPLAQSAPTAVNIGDVNVQFPDTLLWKRRSMLLDSQGYLIMSPALTASGNPKDKANVGATRRMHLSEFRKPTIPDVEMEELPNSVVLDFVEGGGLQIACEDRVGQGRVLNVLQEAHSTWAN